MKNKQEICNQNWQNPRYKFTLAHKTCTQQNFQKLQNFFLICKGQGTAFNFFDVSDHFLNQQIGIGNGITNTFTIYKTYFFEKYAYKRNIYNIKNVKIYVNNQLVENNYYTINKNELLFINNYIPEQNSIIAIEGIFYITARFENDVLQYINKNQYIDIENLSIVETQI